MQGIASLPQLFSDRGAKTFARVREMASEPIALLREAVPTIERVTLIAEANGPSHQVDAATAAARALGLHVTTLATDASADYAKALLAVEGPRAGIVRVSGPGFQARAFAEAAVQRALPTIYFLKVYARAGLLMTYGPIQEAYFPRAVILADRILRGEKVGDLPIEQPAQFEMVINLNTAKALRLPIPPTLLARADEVIE